MELIVFLSFVLIFGVVVYYMLKRSPEASDDWDEDSEDVMRFKEEGKEVE